MRRVWGDDFRVGVCRIESRAPHLGSELGELLEVHVRLLLVLLRVDDHGLILISQLPRLRRILVRLPSHTRTHEISRVTKYTCQCFTPAPPTSRSRIQDERESKSSFRGSGKEMLCAIHDHMVMAGHDTLRADTTSPCMNNCKAPHSFPLLGAWMAGAGDDKKGREVEEGREGEREEVTSEWVARRCGEDQRWPDPTRPLSCIVHWHAPRHPLEGTPYCSYLSLRRGATVATETAGTSLELTQVRGAQQPSLQQETAVASARNSSRYDKQPVQ